MRECAEPASSTGGCIGPTGRAASATRRRRTGEHGITVIDGGCPLMFEPTADLGHKVMRVVFASHVPKHV